MHTPSNLVVTVQRGHTTTVATLSEASRACRDYIEENDLGSSQWTGGDVRRDGKIVAQISYNGRAWTPEKHPNAQEIPLDAAYYDTVRFAPEHVTGFRAPDLPLYHCGDLLLCCYEARVYEVRDVTEPLFGKPLTIRCAFPHSPTPQTAELAAKLTEAYLNAKVPPAALKLYCATLERALANPAFITSIVPETRYTIERWHHAITHQKLVPEHLTVALHKAIEAQAEPAPTALPSRASESKSRASKR